MLYFTYFNEACNFTNLHAKTARALVPGPQPVLRQQTLLSEPWKSQNYLGMKFKIFGSGTNAQQNSCFRQAFFKDFTKYKITCLNVAIQEDLLQ